MNDILCLVAKEPHRLCGNAFGWGVWGRDGIIRLYIHIRIPIVRILTLKERREDKKFGKGGRGGRK